MYRNEANIIVPLRWLSEDILVEGDDALPSEPAVRSREAFRRRTRESQGCTEVLVGFGERDYDVLPCVLRNCATLSRKALVRGDQVCWVLADVFVCDGGDGIAIDQDFLRDSTGAHGVDLEVYLLTVCNSDIGLVGLAGGQESRCGDAPGIVRGRTSLTGVVWSPIEQWLHQWNVVVTLGSRDANPETQPAITLGEVCRDLGWGHRVRDFLDVVRAADWTHIHFKVESVNPHVVRAL